MSCFFIGIFLSELGELEKESVSPCDQRIKSLLDLCGDRISAIELVCTFVGKLEAILLFQLGLFKI